VTTALVINGHNKAREVVVLVPIRTISEANARDHWAKKAKRVKHQRGLTKLLVGQAFALAGVPGFPCTVTLTRIAPSRGLDSDNLASALKSTRDGVSDALGVDDGHPWVKWLCAQRRGSKGQWAVEVQITGGHMPQKPRDCFWPVTT
jgi:hypothetical protein